MSFGNCKLKQHWAATLRKATFWNTDDTKCWWGRGTSRALTQGAWLAQSVERVTLDLEVMSSSPTWGVKLTLKKKKLKTERPLAHVRWECNMVQLLWKTVRRFLTKVNIVFLYNPTLVLLGITQRSWGLCPHKHLYTDVYRSFIHNCPNLKGVKLSFGRWMDKQTVVNPGMEYYSALKRNELSNLEKTWGKLQCNY